jgi:NAD(P)-dependent dehydrogenase (short-subunit alcohol dehydrogenase family)
MDLSGRCAILAGGAGHVGLAAAETLAELGARVCIVDEDKSGSETCVARLHEMNSREAFAIPCDLKSESHIRSTVDEAVNRMGRLDILVHCAACVGTTPLVGWAVPFDQQTTQAWDEGLRINVTSAFVLCRAAEGPLRKSGHGSVIFFASTYGMVGPDMKLYEGTQMGNPAAYGASKGALLQLTRYLATVLAPEIRVNAISPGGIYRNQPAPFVKRYELRTPLGRMATEDDLKGAVAYLAGDLSLYVTAANLVVDGGWTAW